MKTTYWKTTGSPTGSKPVGSFIRVGMMIGVSVLVVVGVSVPVAMGVLVLVAMGVSVLGSVDI